MGHLDEAAECAGTYVYKTHVLYISLAGKHCEAKNVHSNDTMQAGMSWEVS